jgi:hypothetical protein
MQLGMAETMPRYLRRRATKIEGCGDDLFTLNLPYTHAGRVEVLADQLAFELAWTYPRETIQHRDLLWKLRRLLDDHLEGLDGDGVQSSINGVLRHSQMLGYFFNGKPPVVHFRSIL